MYKNTKETKGLVTSAAVGLHQTCKLHKDHRASPPHLQHCQIFFFFGSSSSRRSRRRWRTCSVLFLGHFDLRLLKLSNVPSAFAPACRWRCWSSRAQSLHPRSRSTRREETECSTQSHLLPFYRSWNSSRSAQRRRNVRKQGGRHLHYCYIIKHVQILIQSRLSKYILLFITQHLWKIETYEIKYVLNLILDCFKSWCYLYSTLSLHLWIMNILKNICSFIFCLYWRYWIGYIKRSG